MKRALHHIRKLQSIFFALSSREKKLIIFAIVGFAAYSAVVAVDSVQSMNEQNQVMLARRTRELDELGQLLRRHRQLALRLKQVEQNFSQSEMTVDQVYSELDRIVRESVAGGKYDLKRNPAQAAAEGSDIEQQSFTLRIGSLSLDQIVSLLHRIEQGKAALFLGKVDLVRMPQAGVFSATLEVSSIRKRAA